MLYIFAIKLKTKLWPWLLLLWMLLLLLMVLLITELTCSVMFYLLYNAFTLRYVDSPVACKGHIMERGLRLF